MSEYDSSKLNLDLFRLPLLWFLIAATAAQMFIVLNSPAIPQAGATPAVTAPQVFASPPRGAPPAPVKVELPASRKEMQQVITLAKPKQQLKKAAPATATFGGNAEVAIQFALAQQGKPYIWGGAGPRGYDCSGLVMVAFSKLGLRLPHYTGALIGQGSPVSRGGLQRGDIVFPQRGHVAIYLGDGMMIHAPQPGDVIKISKVYAFYAARRLV